MLKNVWCVCDAVPSGNVKRDANPAAYPEAGFQHKLLDLWPAQQAIPLAKKVNESKRKGSR